VERGKSLEFSSAAVMNDEKRRGNIELGRTSVLRDETPPIPPGPEGSNGNGPFHAQ